jgi:hypothetical protein
MKGLVQVGAYGSRAQAEMMVELLRNEGIDAITEIDDAGGLRPDVPMGMGGAKVLVRPEDEERAREILEYGGDGED